MRVFCTPIDPPSTHPAAWVISTSGILAVSRERNWLQNHQSQEVFLSCLYHSVSSSPSVILGGGTKIQQQYTSLLTPCPRPSPPPLCVAERVQREEKWKWCEKGGRGVGGGSDRRRVPQLGVDLVTVLHRIRLAVFRARAQCPEIIGR